MSISRKKARIKNRDKNKKIGEMRKNSGTHAEYNVGRSQYACNTGGTVSQPMKCIKLRM